MAYGFRAALCGLLLAAPGVAAAEIQELKIPKGAGGIGFLPLLVMEQQKTIEKHAAQLGNKNLKATFVNIGGPAVVNDAQFMHEIGSLKNKAASWKDFFFAEVHDLAGN